MPSATQTARLEARISTELHAMLKRAAEIQVKKGRIEVCFRNNPAADFLPPCCPLTFNFVG